MAFLTVGSTGEIKTRRNSKKKKEYPRKKDAMVYLIKMVLDCGKTVVKIGITTRKSIHDRLMENVLAFFMTYRYIPRTSVKKFSRTPYYTEVEAYLHRTYKEKQTVFEKQFQGWTEYFDVEDIDELVATYEMVMANPLEYITPTDKAVEVAKKVEKDASTPEESINDIDPVMIG